MKNSIEDRQVITSLKKFIEIKESMLYVSDWNPENWVYRGLSDFNYPLIPGVGRLFRKKPFFKKDKLLDFEKYAFNEFLISTYDTLRETNNFIILAVAQHHGLKTRLLDWTLSPLVALFFAVEKEKDNSNDFSKKTSDFKETDGALIAFQAKFPFNDFPDGINSPFNENLNDFHFIFSPSLSPRIRAQQCIFQLFQDPTKEFSSPLLRKFRIPATSKAKIKFELQELGINYKTIYPDNDGLCKSINYNKLKNS